MIEERLRRLLLKRSSGTILVVVLLVLAMLVIAVPVMIYQNMQESKWIVKSEETTQAFHLAEAAIERARLVVIQSTTTFQSIQDGNTLAGYNFDTAYEDIPGGKYSLWVGSGSADNQVEIVAVGRDDKEREVRAIRAVYSKSIIGAVAIHALDAVAISGNNFDVEWGAILTPESITTNANEFPQLWSASDIDSDANGASPPNCDTPDCCQWHSWQTELPPQPDVDLDAYKQEAIGTGTYFSPTTGNHCFSALPGDPRERSVMLAGFVPPFLQGSGEVLGMAAGGGCDTASKDTGYTYYVEDDLDIEAPGAYIRGNLIVIGNLNLPNGNFGSEDVTAPVPALAWKQYCRDWAHYQGFDGGAPAAFPGLDSDYEATGQTAAINKVFVNGFLYVGGDVTASGGGGAGAIIGAVVVKGSVTLGSNSTAGVYYNASVADAIQTSNVVLGLASWQEEVRQWPAGL